MPDTTNNISLTYKTFLFIFPTLKSGKSEVRIFIIGTRKKTKTMAFLSVLISAVAALLFYITGNLALMILAIITASGNFWTWGVMRNKTQTAPKWITWINLVFSLIGIGLLFTAIFLMYF